MTHNKLVEEKEDGSKNLGRINVNRLLGHNADLYYHLQHDV